MEKSIAVRLGSPTDIAETAAQDATVTVVAGGVLHFRVVAVTGTVARLVGSFPGGAARLLHL